PVSDISSGTELWRAESLPLREGGAESPGDAEEILTLQPRNACRRRDVSSARDSTKAAAFVSLASAADCPANSSVNSLSPVVSRGAVKLSCAGNDTGSSPEAMRSSASLFLM